MAGMSRDKCGAADVAGFLKVVSILKPKNIKVIGAMAMVRNSVGSNGYVSDEIITSRAGVRIRVGNTDAEGRTAMVDVLAHMKEKALTEINPHLFTIATCVLSVIDQDGAKSPVGECDGRLFTAAGVLSVQLQVVFYDKNEIFPLESRSRE